MGRKLFVASELSPYFSVLKDENILENKIFNYFIISDNFFKTNYSLPHPYGIGKGFESISKFYYWYKYVFNDCKSNILNIEIEFSKYLIKMAIFSELEIYKISLNGIYLDKYNLTITYNNKEKRFMLRNLHYNNAISISYYDNLIRKNNHVKLKYI